MNRMTLDCFASESHYASHLAPIVAAIPGARLLCASHDAFDAAMRAMLRLPGDHNGKIARAEVPDYNSTVPILVASYRDLLLSPQARRIGLLEHGAGQTYVDAPESPFYPGGAHHDRCALILSPGPHSARRWRAAYPGIPVVELQGSPRLDPHVLCLCGQPKGKHMVIDTLRPDPWWCYGESDPGFRPAAKRYRPTGEPQPPTTTPPDSAHGTVGMGQAGARPVAVSFHWHCGVAKETEATWPYWQHEVEALAKVRPVVGHAHPRLWGTVKHWYEKAGIEAVATFDELLDRCAGGLLLMDNSSIGYEWAALGWPVLCLNEPRLYRPEVEHGLRFWSHPPGGQIDWPDALPEVVASFDPPWPEMHSRSFLATQEAAVMEAYGGYFDGRATERAIAAIEEHLM